MEPRLESNWQLADNPDDSQIKFIFHRYLKACPPCKTSEKIATAGPSCSKTGLKNAKPVCSSLVKTNCCKYSPPYCDKLIELNAGEPMLLTDFGLYRSFDTDTTGRPGGCSGLENWTGGGRNAKCDLNKQKVEDGEIMHEIVEEMASNQQSWANQFAPFLQKMLENGVDVENLSEAQAINDIGSCKVNWRGKKVTC